MIVKEHVKAVSDPVTIMVQRKSSSSSSYLVFLSVSGTPHYTFVDANHDVWTMQKCTKRYGPSFWEAATSPGPRETLFFKQANGPISIKSSPRGKTRYW